MVTELPAAPQVETEHYTPPQTPRACRAAQRPSLQDQALSWIAAGCQMAFGPRERTGLGILTYHRIADPPANRPRPTWNVRPERFQKQIAGLLKRGWQAWPLRQALHYAERELPIPRKTFVVTFDVGYANVLLEACPVLTRLRVPATLFLSTAYLDSQEPFPGDDWEAAGVPGTPTDAWRFLTTDECRRLMGNGLIEIGSHTRHHRDFRDRPVELLADLKDNLNVLKDTFGIDQPSFAPSPVPTDERPTNDELTQAARQAGTICCLTDEPRVIPLKETPFNWGRFTVSEYDTAATLAGKLGGWHTAVQGLGQDALDHRPRVQGP
ncbi:MAG TPA: polysaccharide deacetylase family protein [Pirellulaceae bacterium]|nr:polysaccharide deacetylase family protein [Pirellulaceae bacterium]